MASAETKLKEFFLKGKKVNFQPHEIIIRPKEEIKYIYYLVEGSVRQYTITKQGIDLNLYAFKEGTFLPMMLILADRENGYYFESITELVTYMQPVSDVLDFVKSDANVSFELSERFAKGLCSMLDKTEKTLYRDAYSRIISILKFLSIKFGKEKNGYSVISIPLTHGDIASWTGMQRETASRQLEILKSKKIIMYFGNKLGVDLNALESENVLYSQGK